MYIIQITKCKETKKGNHTEIKELSVTASHVNDSFAEIKDNEELGEFVREMFNRVDNN